MKHKLNFNVEDLLEKAKQDYPPGTEYLNAKNRYTEETIYEDQEGFEIFIHEDYEPGQFGITPIKGPGLVYFDGHWADITKEKESPLHAALKIIYED